MKNAPASAESENAPAPVLPAAEYRRLIEENNVLIRSTDLDNGAMIVKARARIHFPFIQDWAAGVVAETGYHRPFAVAAVGGTGREEVTPCSDLDIVFLFADQIEEPNCREFVKELQAQSLHTSRFRDRYGFSLNALPYSLADVPELKDKTLNAFLDLAPIYDPHDLTGQFRQKIRESFDSFEHFLHVRQLWRRLWESAGALAERIGRFDIKNDGLRLFLGGIWTLGGREFEHSRDVYPRLDARDVEAYEFLLRVRSWIHLRRPAGGVADAMGNHGEDVMTFADFDSFGDWLGADATDEERLKFAETVRARLMGARRRIAAFARGVIEGELRPGRPVSTGNPVRLGAGGMFFAHPEANKTDSDRSRAALRVLHMAQRYELPVDPSELLTTFRNAGDWLVPVPEMGELFRETRGCLASTFDFLSQIPGAEERLFPGYGKFESSIDERVRTERKALRGPMEREKMRALDAYRKEGLHLLADARDPDRLTDVGYQIRVELEAAQLSPSQLAGVRLALKTKRLPVTADDFAARADAARPQADRFSSGFSEIPVASYYARYVRDAGFDGDSVELAGFLVENRRAFREVADAGINDEAAVAELLNRCGNDTERLRALYVFTLVDRHAWESAETHPERFFNSLEIYAKARMPAHRRFEPRRLLNEAGCHDPAWQEMLLDFGRDLYTGIYRHHLIRFVPFLIRMAEAKSADRTKPKAQMIVNPPFSFLGVAARDRRGIAASISGALWKNGIVLRQAHLFSAMNYRLALDFFHLAPAKSKADIAGPDVCRLVEDAVISGDHISEADEAALPDVARRVSIVEWRPGLHRIQAETHGDVGALIYLLCLKSFRQLGADVHGLTAQTSRANSRASVFVSFPKTLGIEQARRIVEAWG